MVTPRLGLLWFNTQRTRLLRVASVGMSLGALSAGCEDSVDQPVAPDFESVYALNDGCFVLNAANPGQEDSRYLVATRDGLGYVFRGRSADRATRLRLKASDLGTYLLYDEDQRYVVAEEDQLTSAAVLDTEVSLGLESFISPAEWELTVSEHDPERLALRNRRTQRYMGRLGTTDDAAEAGVLTLSPAEGCSTFPELTVDASGEVERTTFEDGDLYGIAETHTHPFTNLGFGGTGVVFGAPFHRLGVEAALPDCEQVHGTDGENDLMGAVYDSGAELEIEPLAAAVITGRLGMPVHGTAGFPEFSDWPDATRRATHQTQYYKWIERAYLGGLRLLVAHTVSNQVLCDLYTGSRAQAARYSCNDMVAIERQVAAARDMERYIDAQSGGPGRGWFRIVTEPAQAREVIESGKLAVVLGIETSNLFDCFAVPREGFPACNAEHVRAELTRYQELGVRAIFPVHKYDNAFSPGDGQRGFIQVASVLNTGHYNNFTETCDSSVRANFDGFSAVQFGSLNQPRDEYFSAAPLRVDTLGTAAARTVIQLIGDLSSDSLEGGPYCQNAGLQPLGEVLLTEMMQRGLIIEIGHLPNRALARAFEMLEEADYPAVDTHNNAHNGRIYELGGLASSRVVGRCQEPNREGAMGDVIRERVQLIRDAGGYLAVPFSLDLNGFASVPGPRFGPEGCGDGQTNPITYPFMSHAGDVVMEQPRLGNRVVDFNTEGFVHIGLIPELLEDLRRDGVPDEEIDYVFRSAEAYVRMWEQSVARGAAIAAAAM